MRYKVVHTGHLRCAAVASRSSRRRRASSPPPPTLAIKFWPNEESVVQVQGITQSCWEGKGWGQMEPWVEQHVLPLLKPADLVPDAVALGADGFHAACPMCVSGVRRSDLAGGMAIVQALGREDEEEMAAGGVCAQVGALQADAEHTTDGGSG
uniref:Uncharacterized protein n=1 Tax=Oryza glaberrima TaxID=4538 RepID=A0A679BDD0_ORYGL|nr:hypothetical protein [Oryza glaberrima]